MPGFDAHANFPYSLVATAPSPAASGTSLVVTAAQGARFPAVPFNAAIWPVGVLPTPANGELVRVTARATDTLTIVRAQEGTSARTVLVGDQIAAVVTAKTLTDIEIKLFEYLVDGVVYAQTRAGIQAAIDAANSAGGGIVRLPPNTTIVLDATPISMKSNVTLKGSGWTSILRPVAGATDVDMIRIWGGNPTAERALNATATEGAATIVLAAGGVAALGLTVGDFIYIFDSATSFNQAAKVLAIATETITLDAPVGYAFPVATTGVAKWTSVLTNMAVEDLAFDGKNNSGTTTRGIYATYIVRLKMRNLRFYGLTAQGYYGSETWDVVGRDLEMEESGNGGAADFQHTNSSNFLFDGLRSFNSTGFGPQFETCIHGQYMNVYSAHSTSRNHKIMDCRWVNGMNITCIGSTSASTGFSSVSNYNCTFTNITNIGSGTGAGVWISDDLALAAGNDCVYNNIVSRYNGGFDLQIDPGCLRNRFNNLIVGGPNYVNDQSPSSWFNGKQKKTVKADRSTSTIALSDITDLNNFELEANKTYHFRAVLFCTSNAVTVGIHHGVNFSGTTTRIKVGELVNPVTAPTAAGSGVAFGYAAAVATKAIATTAGPGTAPVEIVVEGVIVVGATGGTFAFQHGSETATATTTLQDSYAEVEELAA